MEKTEERYNATVVPYLDCWMVHIYDGTRPKYSEAFAFRWQARLWTRRRLKRLRKGAEVIH